MKNADIGRYLISDDGVIVSKRTGRPIKPKLSKHGYMVFTMYGDGRRRTEYVHRVIATAFCPNTKDGSEVNHLDGDKKNNAASNLEWCSRSENLKHAHVTGLQAATRLALLDNGKYKGPIKGRHLETGKEIEIPALTHCKMFGLNQGRVSRVISGHEASHKGFVFWRDGDA